MSWCYAAALDENGQWTVREVYYLSPSGGTAWSSDPVVPQGDTRGELLAALSMMVSDVAGADCYVDLTTGKIVDG